MAMRQRVLGDTRSKEFDPAYNREPVQVRNNGVTAQSFDAGQVMELDGTEYIPIGSDTGDDAAVILAAKTKLLQPAEITTAAALVRGPLLLNETQLVIGDAVADDVNDALANLPVPIIVKSRPSVSMGMPPSGVHPNLKSFAQRLLSGNCRMAWIGDSLSAESNEPRWPQSIIKAFDIDWQGRFIPSGTFSAPNNGLQTFSHSALVPTPGNGGVLLSGETIHWPRNWWDEQRADIGVGAATRRWQLQVLNTYFRGAWTQDKEIAARMITYDGTGTIGGQLRISQNSTGSEFTTNDWGHPAHLNYDGSQEIEFKDFLVTGTPAEPDITWDFVLEGSSAVNESTGPQNCAGCLWHVPSATTGLQLGVIAEGGWDHHDHRSGLAGDPSFVTGGQYSDQAIFNYCKYLRSLNTVVIHVVNDADDETGLSGAALRAAFKANLVHIITRWRTQMLAAAADNGDTITPMFFLLSPWTTLNAATRSARDELHNAALELQDERNDTSTLYMNTMMDAKYGEWSTWQATFLSDTIHQAAAGVIPIGETLHEQLVAAAAG